MIRGCLLLLAAWCAPALAAMEPADAAPAGAAAQMAAAATQVSTAGIGLTAAQADIDDIAGLADAVATYEAALAALRASVQAATAERTVLEVEIAGQRDRSARLLGTLAAISRTPPPPGGLHPQGPIAAARASAVMERLQPAMKAAAVSIAARATALAAAEDLEDSARAQLEAATATLGTAQAALAAALAATAPEPGDNVNTPALTMMARDSESLTALAAALARSEGAPAPPAAPSAEPLLWPVSGEVLRGFNEPDAAGVRRPGIVVVAPPLALVRAPADAVVRYAGPFLEYGYVVVLEPDRETMLVLAGMAQIRVQTGAAVHRGDLLGLLGGRQPDVEETVMPGGGAGAGVSETLYIEARHGRGPVDPQPLFDGKDG